MEKPVGQGEKDEICGKGELSKGCGYDKCSCDMKI